MSHYFTTDPTPEKTRDICVNLFGNHVTLTTSPGVFSGSRLEPGTAVLLRTVEPPTRGTVLDVGCGYGPIALGLALASPSITVDAVDVNAVAVDLTRRNAQALGVADRVHAALPDELPERTYDQIWSNPPIRIGKAPLHALLVRWLPKLNANGVAWLVVSKNLGADSLTTWLTDQGWPTQKVASAKGFRVLRVTPQANSRD